MTKYEDPNSGNAQVFEDIGQLQVRVKSKSSIFVTLFLGFWLCGWAFGEVAAIGVLLSGETGGVSIFLLAWLGAWTVGGAFALAQFLWGIAGYELLSLSKNTLTIQRHIPFYRRTWTYKAEHIKDIRLNLSNSAPTSFFSREQNMVGLFSNRNNGSIKFDYGMQTPGFGFNLEEAEANLIIEKLSKRLGIT